MTDTTSFEERLAQVMQPFITQSTGERSTHKMAAEIDENGDWFAFPLIQKQTDGKLKELPTKEAQAKAIKEGNVKRFGKDKDGALRYAAGGYKRGTPIDDARNQQKVSDNLLKDLGL
jgi:hypothetical protein